MEMRTILKSNNNNKENQIRGSRERPSQLKPLGSWGYIPLRNTLCSLLDILFFPVFFLKFSCCGHILSIKMYISGFCILFQRHLYTNWGLFLQDQPSLTVDVNNSCNYFIKMQIRYHWIERISYMQIFAFHPIWIGHVLNLIDQLKILKDCRSYNWLNWNRPY